MPEPSCAPRRGPCDAVMPGRPTAGKRRSIGPHLSRGEYGPFPKRLRDRSRGDPALRDRHPVVRGAGRVRTAADRLRTLPGPAECRCRHRPAGGVLIAEAASPGRGGRVPGGRGLDARRGELLLRAGWSRDRSCCSAAGSAERSMSVPAARVGQGARPSIRVRGDPVAPAARPGPAARRFSTMRPDGLRGCRRESDQKSAHPPARCQSSTLKETVPERCVMPVPTQSSRLMAGVTETRSAIEPVNSPEVMVSVTMVWPAVVTTARVA